MSYTRRSGEEIENLKDELSRLVSESADAAVSASRGKIEDAAKMLGGVMDDIEQLAAHKEEDIEAFISGRPLVSVAAAFVAGLAIGLVLRRLT